MNLFIRELRKLLALAKADPKSLAAGIIAPTVILVIFALTFGNFVALKLAVVNDDMGELGSAFLGAVFSQTSPLSGEPYFEAIEADAAGAQELYEQGRVNGILTIPEDFSGRLASGEPAQILYAFDNYNTDMAKNLRLYLDEGIFAFYQEHMPGMEIEVQREYAVGAQLDWFAIIAVGVFMLAFLMGSMFNFL
ncbi:MAG TPA: ABC transporter permease, partial [Slackia equolifaciens]|nr:ABC transporter permease [Slackia equolifaciens]